MSVVFDEVVGTVAPEPMPREEPEGEQSSAAQQGGSVREEIQTLEHRLTRLRAD
ncbi:MAG TPA: hypothetical protein VKD91_22085 [Pyrinomonadaceae bacterium]|nr:hypothetical protein [Pyrinomonadaceae bacterium]